MKQNLLAIINHYGIMAQLKYLQTEIFELNQAIIEYQYDENKYYEIVEKMLKKHIEEEFADVMVMLEQIKAYYELDNDRIVDIMYQKIDRQLERIANDR